MTLDSHVARAAPRWPASQLVATGPKAGLKTTAKSVLALTVVAVVAACGQVADQGVGGGLSSRTAPNMTLTSCSSHTAPAGRLGAALSYDSLHRELVLFGGDVAVAPSIGSSSDTWVQTTGCWSQMHPVVSPTSRSYAATVYDSVHNVTVLYGGRQSSPGMRPNVLTDTWLWDGANWSSMQVTPAPSLTSPLGAFDLGSKRVILFGTPSSGSPTETWAWDGTRWLQLHPTVSPLARLDGSMSYDSRSNRVVLYGGFNAGIGALGDTWTWDGINWAQERPATSPPPRIGSTMCGGQELFLFGGSGTSAPGASDMWVWSNKNWRQIASAHTPGARRHAACAFTGDLIVVFGGQDSNGQLVGDSWSFLNGDWQPGQ
jgi:hypothetical protein